jgi:hypothetical protein
MKAVGMQSFSHWLADGHFDDGVNSKPTPRTKVVLLSAAHLESVGHESIVLNRDMHLREAANVYLGRQLFAPQAPKAILTNAKYDSGLVYPQNHYLVGMFHPMQTSITVYLIGMESQSRIGLTLYVL